MNCEVDQRNPFYVYISINQDNHAANITVKQGENDPGRHEHLLFKVLWHLQ